MLNLSPLTLVGDQLENLYQLGLKDKLAYPELKKSFRSLISDNQILQTCLTTAKEIYVLRLFKRLPEFHNKIKAYSEGLGVRPSEYGAEILIPEFLSSISHWAKIPTSLLGCSSAFAMSANGPMHLRILDFPLVGSYDLNQRLLQTQFKGQAKIMSLGATGLFYPALTAMNSHGITCALHQKFSGHFNPKGTPIFELVNELLSQADSKESALHIIKNAKSMTTWGLYLSFKDGEVLEIDLLGDGFLKKEYQLEENNIFYFNNIPLQSSKSATLPLGMEHYCQMRMAWAKEIISENKTDSPLKEQDLCQMFARHKILRKDHGKDWKLTPLTPTSLSVSVMNAKAGNLCVVNNLAPALFNNQFLNFENVWQKTIITSTPLDRVIMPTEYDHAYKHLGVSQSYLQEGNNHLSFHHLQMALAQLKNTDLEYVISFFKNVMEYNHLNKIRDLEILENNFITNVDKLPIYYQDHTWLFVMRIHKLLDKKVTVNSDNIQNTHLKCIFEWEMSKPKSIILLLKKLIIPRLDIFDVFYLYTHQALNKVSLSPHVEREN